MRLEVLAVVEIKKKCLYFKTINKFQKMADKENVQPLKLDCQEKAIFDKIIKEGNGGKVKSYA